MKWYEKYARQHRLDEMIYSGGDTESPYLLRWFLIPKNPILNIFLHKFVGHDRRTLHDHPWCSISYQLDGFMQEHYVNNPDQPVQKRLLMPNKWVFRSATFLHFLTLRSEVVWTIFITGPKFREWGFLHSTGWESASKLFTREGIKRSAEQ